MFVTFKNILILTRPQRVSNGIYIYIYIYIYILFLLWRCDPTRVMAPSFFRFIDHTHNDAPQSIGLLWTSD